MSALSSESSSPDSNPVKPLTGIRVLDLTRVLAGPYCTMILADLGAEVVKIERPEIGDDSRGFGPFLPSGVSAYFASLNRGKLSVTMDLKQPDDQAKFRQLVSKADVLVENFRPGTMESLGLGHEELQKLNPRLVYASASGFGRGSAYGRRPAYDIIIQAMSGLMSITGDDPASPVRVGTSISDILTGMFTAIGVLAALLERSNQNHAPTLDVAMLDATVAALENALSRYEVTGEVPGPLGTRHPSITPFQAFRTADKPIVLAAGNDALWRKLCEVLEAPELVDDERLIDNHTRTVNRDYMEVQLEAVLMRKPSAYWLENLEQAGIPTAPIRNMKEVAEDPHLAARGVLHRMHDGGSGTFVTAGSPMRFDGHATPLSEHAPKLGEHTADILSRWV